MLRFQNLSLVQHLDLLGANYQFSTRVFVNGTFDSDSGIVRGDLCFYGGDPGLTAERLWLLLNIFIILGFVK